MSTNNQYKLPTDIESRFADAYDEADEQRRNGKPYTAVRTMRQYTATELVKQLEWMLGEIGEDEPDHSNKYGVEQLAINYRNARKQKLRAKVQAKLQEYTG